MNDIETLKKVHDQYITIAHVFGTRVTWYAEEFEGVKGIISLCDQMAKKIKEDIEAQEPPKAEETPKLTPVQ